MTLCRSLRAVYQPSGAGRKRGRARLCRCHQSWTVAGRPRGGLPGYGRDVEEEESRMSTTVTVELTRAEATAVANVLFMSLRPNNVRPAFDTFAEVEAMEAGYQKIAAPITDLGGCRCARCGREWAASMPSWDSLGDPETGELELVCEQCVTPEEHAAFA